MFLQGSDGGQAVDGVSGKAGYALGHDQVDLTRQRVADHAVEAVTLSGVAAGDALVRIHGDERPVGAAGDVMGVVVDLCLVAGELLVPVGGNAGVGRDSALFPGQRRPRSVQPERWME